MSKRSPSRLRSKTPFAAAALAIVIGALYLRASLAIPVLHDAFGYYRLAKEIWAEGLFSKWELSQLRTWGYPAFLGGLLKIADLTRSSERWLVFFVQIAIHISSAFALRAALRRADVRHWIQETAFYTTLLHPFALIYPAYTLTESLALSLSIAVLACAVALLSESRRRATIAGLGGVLCGFLIEVRPGCVFMIPVFLLGLASVWFLKRPALKQMFRIVAVSLLSFTLPLLPQMRNNFVHYGKFSALTAEPLSKYLVYVGIIWIKYATLVDPVRDPHIHYDNPFSTDERLAARSPGSWYAQHPGKGAATIGLHFFNLLDQDLPLPYNTTLRPAYYPYVTIANLAIVAVGFAGIGFVVAGWRKWTQPERWTAALALVMLGSHLGLQSLFSVEVRYGVPALVVLYPFAAIGAAFVRSAPVRTRVSVAALVAVFCVGGTWLSAWVRWQSPAIRAEYNQQATNTK